MLIILCGLPGVGKSTVGKILRRKLKNVLLESDKLKPLSKILKKLEKGGFPKEEIKKSIYNTLFINGAKKLAMGKSVILNATFFKKIYRDQAREMAKELGVKFYIIEVKCDKDIALERIKRRYKASKSEVTERVYYIIKARFEEIKEKKFVVDNSGSVKELEKQIDDIITRDFKKGRGTE